VRGRETAGAIKDLPRAKESLFLNIPYDSSFIFTQLCNAFVRLRSQPTPRDIEHIYRRLTPLLPDLQEQAGASSPFEARVFKELVIAAREPTRRQIALQSSPSRQP